MLSCREFLRYSALAAAGVIAADQLELLDRLAPRSLFAGADLTSVKWGGTAHYWDAMSAEPVIRRALDPFRAAELADQQRLFRAGIVNMQQAVGKQTYGLAWTTA